MVESSLSERGLMAKSVTDTGLLTDEVIDGLFYLPEVRNELATFKELIGDTAPEALPQTTKRAILDTLLDLGHLTLTLSPEAEAVALKNDPTYVPLIDQALLERILADPQAIQMIESFFAGTQIEGEKLLDMPRAKQWDTVSAIIAAIDRDGQNPE